MTQHLATKPDLAHWGELLSQRIDALDGRLSQRIDSLGARIDARFASAAAETDLRLQSLESRFASTAAETDLKLQTLESRIVVKLGALMTFLLAVTGAAVTLVR